MNTRQLRLRHAEISMSRVLLAFALILMLAAQSQGQTKAPGHYMFAWTGDVDKKGTDFLAVIDADPASAAYGRLITTLVTDQQTMRVHHTEYVMPARHAICERP
jgi:56kDa selenium binding protein (SBP56)